MRKKTMLLTIIMLLFIPIKVYATSPTIEAKVSGEVKNGQEINIVVNAKDLQGLYAASVNFTYDKKVLNILEITPGETIKKHSDEIMEIGGEVDSENNKTSYSFTFLGDKQGLSGAVTLVTIKAKVLSDSELSIGEDKLEVKLVKRAGDTVNNYDYKFVGYNTESTSTKPNTGENQNTSNTEDNYSGENDTSNNSNNSTSNNSNNSSTGNDNNSNNSNSNGNSNITNDKDNTNTNDENNKTLENNNDKNSTEDENNSDSDKKDLDTSKEENKNDKEVTSDNNEEKDNKVILIISSLIVLFVLVGGMYYNKRKKLNSSK